MTEPWNRYRTQWTRNRTIPIIMLTLLPTITPTLWAWQWTITWTPTQGEPDRKSSSLPMIHPDGPPTPTTFLPCTPLNPIPVNNEIHDLASIGTPDTVLVVNSLSPDLFSFSDNPDHYESLVTVYHKKTSSKHVTDKEQFTILGSLLEATPRTCINVTSPLRISTLPLTASGEVGTCLWIPSDGFHD